MSYSTDTRRRDRYVKAWLALGLAIALALSANAVRDYLFVARVLATQQTRHRMSEVTFQIEQRMRRSGTLTNALSDISREELGQGVALTLRFGDGRVIEHVGNAYPQPFSGEQEHSALERHQPLFTTRTVAGTTLVTEVFGMRSPRSADALSQPPTRGPMERPRPLLLELTWPLQPAGHESLLPIRRNLVINLAAASAFMLTILLSAIGLRSYVKGRQLEEQVELTREVQARLLPRSTANLGYTNVATYYQPAERVGGDFYDVFATDAVDLAAVIGDVSGKGLPAALLMGVIHGAVRTARWEQNLSSLTHATHRLNRLLCDRASDNRFCSLFWCAYKQDTNSLSYVNAGHCSPLIFRQEQHEVLCARLTGGGPVLGLLADAEYGAYTVPVEAGDLLVLYSDGLIEASNSSGEEFGEERLTELIRDSFAQSPEQMIASIRELWESQAATWTVGDDLTLMIMRF